jgi:hypothetical protein
MTSLLLDLGAELPGAYSAARKCYVYDDLWAIGNPSEMPQIKLKVVRDAILPSPWTAPAGAGPLFTGSGDTDYACGVCEFIIAASIGLGQRVALIETECPCCGAVNEVAIGAD